MRKQIFRTFLILSLLLFFIVSATAVIIHQVLKTQSEIQHLTTFSLVLKAAVDNGDSSFLHNIKTEAIRITLIDPDGTVVYDSAIDESTLTNHLTRQEIASALKTGQGNALRYSKTLNEETYYYALKLKNGQVLRLSFTSESLFAYTTTFVIFMLLVLICVCALCYYVATKLANTLIEPFDNINLDDNRSLSNALSHSYEELHPFLWRIAMQQHKIDEQLNELRLKNNEFQAITKSMSDGLVVLNSHGMIVSINKTARKIFAVTKENCLNQSYLAIDNSQYMQDMMANSATRPKQTMNIVKDGRDFEVRFSKIEDQGACVGFVLIILDVTEKKRTEQLRQEFTANVSHELKTPLQSIIGYSEMMASGFVQPDDIKHFASRIHKQSTRLKNLIDDIIFLSHLDECQVSNMELISVRTLSEEVFEALQEKALERLVRLSLRGPDLQFVAVSRYIYELIYNLVDNAIRYNRENGRVIIALNETNNKYMIEVSDTGIGISHEDQFRIFERFYRVDKSHSRQTGGTGLGLSIVKRVVLYHQGKIRVSSTLGKGTTFTVVFYKDKLKALQEANEKKQQEYLKQKQEQKDQLASNLTAASFRAAEEAARNQNSNYALLKAAAAAANAQRNASTANADASSADEAAATADATTDTAEAKDASATTTADNKKESAPSTAPDPAVEVSAAESAVEIPSSTEQRARE